MNSVDRATLIDFALGRLDAAEAAALARRAEREPAFAQTLAALRQELASLDAARPATLQDLSRRSSFSAFDAFDAPLPPTAEPCSASTPVAPSDVASPLINETENADRVVFLSAPASNAVKVRRVSPDYPYYANDVDASDADADALEAVFPSTFVNDEEVQKSENQQEAQKEQNGEEAQKEQNDEEAQKEQNNEEAQKEQNGEDRLNSATREDGDSQRLQPTPTRAPGLLNFIPKFISTPRDAQRSAFVAKRARRLDADVVSSLNVADRDGDALSTPNVPTFSRPLNETRLDQSDETDETQENNAFNVSNGAPQDASNVDAARLDQTAETDETQENDAANVSNG
ncbi:MAG: hypothetical protein IJZ10_11895, partial [Thermoguttaceae bacterium]|nr:hypothetical protein [Thermoguttaceae bacterium]